MFAVQFYTASLLQDITHSFEKLYEQFHLQMTPDAMKFKAIDATRITILEGHLSRKSFESYECSSEVNLTIRFDNLSKILNLAHRNDKLVIEGRADFDKLMLKFFDEEGKAGGKFFLNLKDDSRIDYESLEPMTFRHSVEVPSKILQKIIYDLFELDSDIVIRLDDGKAVFELGTQYLTESQQRGDLITANIALSDNSAQGQSSRVLIKSPGGIVQRFSSEYLKALCKPCLFFERVKCSFSENAPMLMEYYIKNSGSIRIYIAPKLM